MDAQKELIEWLRDAYAMERGLETTLRSIAESDSHPRQCRTACAQHLTETQQHARIVESLLKSTGADISSFKTGLGILTEATKGLTTAMADDEVIKDLLASYASEHFEIACYKAIIAAAKVVGQPQIAIACQQIISDEEKMAETIGNALPAIVQEYLSEARREKAA